MINSAALNSTPLNTISGTAPAGSGAIPLGAGGTPAITPQSDTTIYSAFANPANWIGWTIVVRVDGVDIGDQLIDKNSVTIEAERNSARLAEFTVQLSGTVDLLSWTGRAVTIDYKTAAGVEWRRFTGVIANPDLDLIDMTLRCQCTDDLQLKADAIDNTTLQSMTGGYWHPSTFDETSKGWERLQELLSTVPFSAELDQNGVLRVHGWEVSATPNFTFDAGFLAENITLNLVQRSALTNKITLRFSARFERLYHRVELLNWTYPLTVCEAIERLSKVMRNDQVPEAISAAGWRLLNATYTPAWSTGSYLCGAEQVIFNNLAPGSTCIGFSAHAAYRWRQSVTESFDLTIAATDSIAAYGELPAEAETAVDYPTTYEDWGGGNEDFSVLPPGFNLDAAGNQFMDELDFADLAAALNCRIAHEVESKINRTHRSNRAIFTMPLIRDLDFRHTVQVSDGNLSCKGTVAKWREEYDLTGGKMPTMTIELALSSGQSATESATQNWTLPPHTDITAFDPPLIVRQVPNHVGGTYDNPPFDDSMWGFFVNWQAWSGGVPNPLHLYEQKLILKFDAIDEAKTQNATVTVPATINIDVPHNSLVVTA